MWPCFCCGNFFPAEGYGASLQNNEEIVEKCVGPGHWRCCQVCVKLKTSPDTLETQQCQDCKLWRNTTWFANGNPICQPCNFSKSFTIVECTQCQKLVRASECGMDIARKIATVTSVNHQ